MKKVLQIVELLIFNLLLVFAGAWQAFDILNKAGYWTGFFDTFSPILLSIVIALGYFIHKLRFLIGRYTMCNSFPGANACNDVHKYLTGSADTIFKESGPEGQIIPITKIGNSSYSLSGGYAKYLTIIKALIPYSNKAIKMTLPESPYRQIYDPDAYTTFQAAVKTVRKRGMLGFKRKSKCIVLSKGDLQLFQKEFAKDLITNNASEMNKYVRYHYGYIVMSIRLFRPLNCMIKTFFHVDLKWVKGGYPLHWP